MVYNWINSIQRYLYPQSCLLCGSNADFETRFCQTCYEKLPFNHHACPYCALPLPVNTAEGTRCGGCLQQQLPYHSCITALRYEPPLSRLISNLKFRQHLHLTLPLAKLLIHRLAEPDDPPELILPVPLHPRRLRERGFNQAQEIGRVVAKHYGIPLDSRLVKRTRETSAQSDLNEHERRRNLRNAFRIYGSLKGVNVAILDDVVTTGSTITELSKALNRAGADKITVWAVARTESN
ncbi:MAG: ComF family protein [Candidatus Thiodiazotropha sp. DIVDIV]